MGKAKMTQKAASRIQRSTAVKGKVTTKSFAARASRAAAKNNQ